MHTEFIVVLFVLSPAGCECGLLNLFNGWTDEVEQYNPDIKCRGKRETEENRITTEITNSDPEKIVSLMDVEEEKLTDETGEGEKMTISRTKRCPKNYYVGSIRNSARSPSHTPLGLVQITKRESQNYDQQMCATCMAQPICKLFKKCSQCSKFCDDEVEFDSPMPWDNQTVGISNRMAGPKSDITSKTFYPVSTYREGEAKDIICRIIGIPDASDIETVTIWVTTFSNKPPKIAGVMNELPIEDPRKQENLSEFKLRQPESKPIKEPEFSESGAQVLPATSMDKKTLANPELKPRFNDYDEDYPMANTRNIEENVKENPDLMEGPPPFLRSDNGKSDKIIVQPKEFESDESDIDGPEAESVKPEEPGANPTLFSKLETGTPITDGSNLKSGPAQEESKPPSQSPVGAQQADTSTKPPNINEALQEIKVLVENLQTEAKKASDQRLLGSPMDENIPIERATDLVETPSTSADVVPSHVVDNVHKVNKYFINRAQDALDTIRNPEENQTLASNPTRDDHSDMTKRIITDIKKMPQFLLDKFKDTLEGLENNAKSTKDGAKSQTEQEQVKLSSRIGDNDNTITEPDDDDNDKPDREPMVGNPEVPELNTESPTTKAFKNKLEKYFAEIKEKRQKMYSPDKYLKEAAVKAPLDSDNLQSTTENNPSILMTPYDLEKQRELLKGKLKKYIDTVTSKKTTAPAESSPTISETSEPNPENAINVTDPNMGQISSTDTLTESPEPTVGAGLQSNDINHFLPTFPPRPAESFTEISEKPNIFTKYLKNLKFGKPLVSTQNPLETENAVKASQLLSTEKTALLKDKIKQYVSGLKKPEAVSLINPKDLGGNLNNQNLLESPQFPKTDELKDKLKNYVETLKKPVESRMSTLADTKKLPALIRKSSEAQREEINALKRKLDGLLKERVAQPMKLPSPLVSESEPNQASSFPPDVVSGASSTESLTEQVGISNPLDDVKDVEILNRNGFVDENNLIENWSSSLGQIVQSPSQPKDIFFIGNGIKLPLQVKKGTNGSMDLSVDLEKLCSCYNSTCPKNHTAIEETVSAILEKEAELKEQLTLSPDPSNDDQSVKSNIFKRSSDINKIYSELTKPNQDKLSLPFQEVASNLVDAGKRLEESFANMLPQQTVKNELNTMKKNYDRMNNDLLMKLEHEKNLNQLLNANKIKLNKSPSLDVNEYIRKLEREKTLKKLLQPLNLPPQNPVEKTLKQIKDQENLILKNAKDKLLRDVSSNDPLSLQNNLKNKNNIPKLQNQVNEINNNLLKMSDIYQYSKIDSLKNKLEELNNKVEKYEESNERLFVDGSKKIFGGRKNKLVEQEVRLIDKVLSWFSGLSKSKDEK